MKLKTLPLLLILLTSLTATLANTVVKKNEQSTEQKLQAFLTTLSPSEKTALAKKIKAETSAINNPTTVTLYKPTYVLPYYYTQSPYQAIYEGQTPDNQKVMNAEFRYQISLQLPFSRDIFTKGDSFNMGYTQDSFWQVYAESQYFRETNYEPELFYRVNVAPQFSWQTGIVHESNGRGGTYERSWNRVYGETFFSGTNWLLDLSVWKMILKPFSSDLHNANIADYLGNGNTTFSYKLGGSTLSLMLRNQVESGFQRGAEQLTFSIPMHHHFRAFVFAFSGYGQSLIEYDHYTNAYGVGFALNDWI